MLTLSQAHQKLAAATFRLACGPNPNGETEWGTGFFFSVDGHALTAFHNVQQAIEKSAGRMTAYYRDAQLEFDVLTSESVPEPGDVAVLQCRALPSGVQPVTLASLDPALDKHQRDQFWQGRDVSCFGYPVWQSREAGGQVERPLDGHVDSSRAIVRPSEVVTPIDAAETDEWLQFHFGSLAVALDGISGAPILDRETGYVIAVEHRALPGSEFVYATAVGNLPSELVKKYAVVLTPRGLPTSSVRLFYLSARGGLCSARLTIEHDPTPKQSYLSYECPPSWATCDETVNKTVGDILKQRGLSRFGPVIRPRSRGSTRIVVSDSSEANVLVKVDEIAPRTGPPSKTLLQLALALVAHSVYGPSIADVAVCNGLFDQKRPLLSDAQRDGIAQQLQQLGIAVCTCDLGDRVVSGFAGALWVVVQHPDDVQGFLSWRAYLSEFHRYLANRSSDGKWLDEARVHTALIGRGGHVRLTALPWTFRGPTFDAPPIDLLRAIQESPQVVVLGDPGTGKSNALLAYTHALVRRSLGLPDLLPASVMTSEAPVWTPRFPLYIDLQEFPKDVTFEAYVEREIQSHVGIPPRRILESGSLIFFIDAVNQLPADRYDSITLQIKQFKNRYSYNRFVLASRTHNYSPSTLDVPSIYWIEPLNESQQRQLLDNHLSAADRKRVDSLLDQLHSSPALTSIAENPLYLALVACRFDPSRGLPQSRRDLLEDFLRFRYEWGPRRYFENSAEVIDCLSGLALAVVDQSQGGTVFTLDDAESLLKLELTRVFGKRLPERLKRESTRRGVATATLVLEELFQKDLLRRTEQRKEHGASVLVTFPHQTYLEFLAGRRFVQLYQDVSATLRNRLGSTGWDEAAILLVPYLEPSAMRSMFLTLARIDIALAVQCFVKASKEYVHPDSEDALITEMAKLALDSTEVPHRRRAALDGLARINRLRASQELIETLKRGELPQYLCSATADAAVRHRPVRAADIVFAACQGLSGEALGNGLVSLLKLDLQRGMTAVTERLWQADAESVLPVLEHLGQNLDAPPVCSAITRFSEWLDRMAGTWDGRVAVGTVLVRHRFQVAGEAALNQAALRAELRSDDKERCSRAVRAVAKEGLRALAPQLVDLLSSTSPSVRKAAEGVLEAWAATFAPPVALKEAIRRCSESEACLAIIASGLAVPSATTMAAGDAVRPGTEDLLDILVTDEGRLGWAAAFALALHGGAAEALADRLLGMVQSGQGRLVAARCLRALGAANNPKVWTHLCKLLEGVDVERLHNSDEPNPASIIFVRELLHGLLRGQVKSMVTDECLRVLPSVFRLGTAVVLRGANDAWKVLKDTQDQLERDLLERINHDCAACLAVLFQSESEFDRLTALFVMSSWDFLSLGSYQQVFTPDLLRRRLSVPQGLGDGPLEPLLSVLGAILTAAHCRHRELLPDLERLLERSVWPEFRADAMIGNVVYAIGRIGGHDSVARLCEMWDGASAPVRKELADALKRIGPDPRALHEYERMLADSAENTAEKLASLLGSGGDEQTAVRLLAIFRHAGRAGHIRDAAWNAVQTIQGRLRIRVELRAPERAGP